MSTTDLFVELIVIGIGAALWLSLLVFTVFGTNWVSAEAMSSLLALIPLAATVYVLGIVVDRIADIVFNWLWDQRMRRKVYDDEETYFDDRRLIYTHSERMADLLEYGPVGSGSVADGP